MNKIKPQGRIFIFRDAIASLIASANIDYDKTREKMTSWHTLTNNFFQRKILRIFFIKFSDPNEK